MSIESGLYKKVTDNVGVAAIIGKRFYPMVLPQNVVLPAASYQPIGGESNYTIGTKAAQVREPRFQISAWAVTSLASLELVRTIRTAIDHETGTWDDTAVRGAVFQGEPLTFYDEQAKVFQTILEIILAY